MSSLTRSSDSIRNKNTFWKISRLALIMAILVGTPVVGDDFRGGEVGVLIGAIGSDAVLTGEADSIDGFVGLRGGSVFSRHWGWFVDALYANIETVGGLGDARTVTGRSGFDLLLTPEKRARWLFSMGAGWIVVDFEDASFQDMHNPLATIGFGQRIRVGPNRRLRWELRADRTLDDARLDDNHLLQTYAMIGLSWGPGGSPDPSAARDADADGVRDGRDRCPGTTAGADVDDRGCARDDDRDGVPNGIDQCPRTRHGEQIGPDGCLADSDDDGVPDASDYCANTPAPAKVDEWGCPKDSDVDSVYDGMDRCPETPLGARVDTQGCPADQDSDGVFDGLDRCPETPTGTPVDERGCALDAEPSD